MSNRIIFLLLKIIKAEGGVGQQSCFEKMLFEVSLERSLKLKAISWGSIVNNRNNIWCKLN